MFSYIRSYLPEPVNSNVMYYAGMTQCMLQYYINNTFSASEITSRLFVGDLASASNREAMKAQGITHIIPVFNGAYKIFPNDFEYKIIHINDDAWVDIGKFFDESVVYIDKIMNQPDTKIMIHCQRGVSRSVTLMLAYMIYVANREKQIPLELVDEVIDKILHDVKDHRPIAEPNEGFMEALKNYVHRLNEYPPRNVIKSAKPVHDTKTETETETEFKKGI
jgi:predicted protein tyrosine phosphatase